MTAILVFLFSLFSKYGYTQTSYSLSIDQKNRHGTVVISNVPNFYELQYFVDQYDDLSLNCSLHLDYEIQSQKSDGTFTDWFFAKGALTVRTSEFDQGGGTYLLEAISEELKNRRDEFHRTYPGLNQKLQVKDISYNNAKSRCSLNRTSFRQVCVDAFDSRGVLNTSERNFFNTLRKNNPELNIESSEDCEFFDPREIDSLDLSNGNILGLELLKYFPQIRTLNLKNNKNLELEGIRVAKTLRILNLEGVNIKNADSLSGLRNVVSLSLAGNEIENTGFLKNMLSLEILDLSYNQLSHLDTLMSSRIHTLNLVGNNFRDISFLKEKRSLLELYLDKNDILDFSLLSSFSLRKLSLHENRLQKTRPFNEKHCPVQFRAYDFDDLDNEVQAELRQAGRVNKTGENIRKKNYEYVIINEDVLSQNCDIAGRVADPVYKEFRVIVPAPKPRINNGWGF